MGQAPAGNRAARRKATAAARRRDRSQRATDPTSTASSGSRRAGWIPATTASGGVEPEALVVSHSFDSGETGEPYRATVRLAGRRVGINRLPGPRDTFSQEERVEGIVPGSGPVSITSWVYGLEHGDWSVTAELLRHGGHSNRGSRGSAETIAPAAWSWRRWALASDRRKTVHTRWAIAAPLARIPGVIPGSFIVLGVLGILVALVVQSAILSRSDIGLSGSLVVSLIAMLAGLLGAKVWYAVLHPGPWRQAILGGWAVDGFLVAASVVAVTILLLRDQPVAPFLDATAPGIFFAVAIGRLGCFFTGCCAGRCTRARWGIWSSDRTVGARRIPTQLLESAAGLVIGLVAGLLTITDTLRLQGVVFVGSVVAYLLVRQVLLRLRAERRDYLWRRNTLASNAGS